MCLILWCLMSWNDCSVTRIRTWHFFLVFLTLVLLVWGIWSFQATSDKSEWGSVSGALGQWVGGLAAAVAILFTLFLARRDGSAAESRWKADAEASEKRWRTELRDREDREHRAAERLGHHNARLVVAQAGQIWNSQLRDFEGFAEITNFGPEPVMRPRLEAFFHPGGGTGRWEFNSSFDDWTVPGWIAPNSSSKIPVDDVYFEPALTAEQLDLRLGWVPIITYQDAAGRRWRRVGTDEPQRRDDDDPDAIDGPDWYR
jgi:hypothetical protein